MAELEEDFDLNNLIHAIELIGQRFVSKLFMSQSVKKKKAWTPSAKYKRGYEKETTK